ncbi:hypothetical protein [Streptomyces sp. NBC_01789]|uniref:hypothetical protein n=1 Tax=Streptomyces sp. NBC_01789 TaxID=2975941 RepID=UPI00225ABAC2|nr:hypothetical protein [Streptomyces sp. NBC_01789]MCX4447588.1 hypothetical protein [Streptomyces sp. NBC_01789]
MSKSTAERVRERAQAPDGPPPVWSGRAIVAGAGALYVGAALAAEVYGFVELTAEAPAQGDGPGGVMLILPFLTCFGVPSALVASLWLALPTVSAARWASARLTGRDAWWWVPALALLPVSAATAVVGVVKHPGAGALAWAWLTGAVLLAGAALVARDAALHGRRLLRVLGYGGLAAVAVLGVGAAAFGTGLVTEYSPPKTDAAGLVGTWTDGHGGTLRLSPDGTARAGNLKDHEAAYKNDADVARATYRCTGTGTWSYEWDDSTSAWDQRVRLELADCELGELDGWRIGGTSEGLKLNAQYGDADDPHWYTLTR